MNQKILSVKEASPVKYQSVEDYFKSKNMTSSDLKKEIIKMKKYPPNKNCKQINGIEDVKAKDLAKGFSFIQEEKMSEENLRVRQLISDNIIMQIKKHTESSLSSFTGNNKLLQMNYEAFVLGLAISLKISSNYSSDVANYIVDAINKELTTQALFEYILLICNRHLQS